MAEKMRIGVVGCGDISGRYLANLAKFPNLSVVACADLVEERAQGRAKEFGVPRVCATEELLASRDIDLVVNLTPPKAHAPVSSAALNAGKHVYSEKPLAAGLDEGRALLGLAKSKGLSVGCAPDTFLGGGIQTSIKMLDDGWIGRPVAAGAFQMRCPPEAEYPQVTFVYERGAGPVFDMGPYYFTALVVLLGPIQRVMASAKITSTDRVISVAPNIGKRLVVEAPTHATGVIDFVSGAVATLITSYDVWGSRLPNIEVYGTSGTLIVPDPNSFGGPVLVHRGMGQTWNEVPLTHGYSENSRGVGVADMAQAIRAGRPYRASGELAFHVLEAMHGFLESSRTGRAYELASTCARPAPFPMDLLPGAVD